MIHLTIRGEIESAIKAEATKQGTDPEAIALEWLKKGFPSPAVKRCESPATSLYDLLKEHIGVLSSEGHPGEGTLSQNTRARFAEDLLEKYRRSKL